jgi:dienelactone hydrolase
VRLSVRASERERRACHICALAGFSQGATAAALYLAHARSPPALRFTVLVGGFLPLDPAHAASIRVAAPAVPSLLVMGEKDELVPEERSRQLGAALAPGAAQWLKHPGAHMVSRGHGGRAAAEWRGVACVQGGRAAGRAALRARRSPRALASSRRAWWSSSAAQGPRQGPRHRRRQGRRPCRRRGRFPWFCL